MRGKISVIVPVYNAEAFLRRCVDSILVQTMADFELILVNDGSRDRSGEICDEYASKDSRIIAIQKPNGGVSSARNAGLDIASGEWICFIDADDYIEQDFFPKDFDESVSLYMKNWAVFGGATLSPGNISPQTIEGVEMLQGFFADYMQESICRTPWAKFFKRSIIERNDIRFNTDYKLGEDTLFDMAYFAYVDKVEVLDGGKYMYFCAEGNSNTKYTQSVDKTLEFVDEYWRLYLKQPFKSKGAMKFLGEFSRNLSNVSGMTRRESLRLKTNRIIMKATYDAGKYAGVKGHFKYYLLCVTAPLIRVMVK